MTTKNLFYFLALIDLIATCPCLAQKPEVGLKAPEISSAIWVKPDTQRNLKGKPMLIDFWATWCSPCVVEFPKLNELQEKYKSKIDIVSISIEPEAKIKLFTQKRNLNTVVLSDPNGRISEKYQVQALPTKFLVDSLGVISWIGVGSAMIDSVLSRFVAGKPLDKYISNSITEKQKKMVEIMLPQEHVKDELYTFKAFKTSDDFKRHMMITSPSPSTLLVLANNVTEIDFLKKYYKNSDLRYKSRGEEPKSHVYFETKLLTEDEANWIVAINLAASNLRTFTLKKEKVNGLQLTVADQEKFKSVLYDYKSPGKIQIENNSLEFVCYDIKSLEAILEEHFKQYFNFLIDDKDVLLGLTLDVTSINSLKEAFARMGVVMNQSSFEIDIVDFKKN